MLITKEVSMDLNYRESPIVMDVQQGDTGRVLRIHFTAGGEPWNVPEDGSIVMQYQCADGSGGMYDTLPDGTPAYSIEENVLTIRLAAQLCAVAGSTKLQVTFFRGDIQISTVYMEIRVAPQIHAKTATAAYTNLAQWMEENGKPGPQGPKGDKGDKGEVGDATPELEALRDQVTEDANRAEEAAAALEGGLVLRKGDGLDSVVLAVSDAEEKPAAVPAANGETAISLGRYCVVGTEEAVATNEKAGKNSMAVNYKNTVNGERAFAANGYNTVTEAGQYASAFGYGNTVSAERAFACGSTNEVSGSKAFGAGTSNKVNAINGFAAGQSNTVDSENGASFGELNKVTGRVAFAAGGYNELIGDGSFTAGAFHTIHDAYGASLGNRNEVESESGMAFGEVLQVTERAQVAVGRANDPVAGALFMVGNGTYEVPAAGEPATNIQRSNAFEVHDDHIVVGGKTLSAETIGNIGKDKTPELIEITSEENMREKLVEVLDSMETGTARTIRFEDRGNTFGFNSLYATAYVYKDEFYQDLGLELYGRLFASIIIETVQGIYHLACVKIINETYSRWHDWTFPNLQGQKVLRESEIDSKISAIETGIQTGFDTGKISEQECVIQKAKLISATISDGAVTYTTTIAWDSLGLSLDADGNTLADQIWLPFDGVSLLIEKETEQATVKIENTDGGSASIVHLCGVN